MKLNDIKDEMSISRKLKQMRTRWEDKMAMRRKIERKFENFTGWLIVPGDLHIPYTEWKMVFDKMIPNIEKLKGKKMFVLPGDTFTYDMFSTFAKSRKYTASPIREIVDGGRFFNIMSDIVDFTIMIVTNHENRLQKFLTDRIKGVQEQEDVQNFLVTFHDYFEDIPRFAVCDDWLIQIGEAIIPHGGPGSVSIAGRTAVWGIDYFVDGEGINLVNKNWTTLFQPHIHKQAKVRRRGKFGIEVGVLCKPLDYQLTGSRSYTYGKHGRWNRGYGQAYLTNGKVDVNTANFIALDV